MSMAAKPLSVTMLRKSPEEAIPKLQERVETGEALLERYGLVTCGGSDTRLSEDTETWHSVNEQVLRTLFTDTRHADAYRQASRPPALPIVVEGQRPSLFGLSGRSRSLDRNFQPYERSTPLPSPPRPSAESLVSKSIRYLKKVTALVPETEQEPSTIDTYLKARKRLRQEGPASPYLPGVRSPLPVPFVNNGTYIVGHGNYAATQQGTVNSNQAVGSANQTVDLSDWLNQLEDALPTLPLTADAKKSLERSLTTVKNELEEEKPEDGTIRTGLERIQHFLGTVAEHAAAEQLLISLPLIFHSLSHIHS